MDLTPFDLDDAVPVFRLRGRQAEWKAQIHEDLKTRSRLLIVAPGGVGKTRVMGALAKDMWARGIRTLILESRDRLTEQTAESIRETSGLDVDVEKGNQRASPHAPIVVACVPSMAKIPRLTGFAPGHFGCVIPDETHLALAPSWLRIIFYHHYGAESLADDWVRPDDGKYRPKCSVVGFTASPNLGKGQSLSTLYHHTSVNYSYLDAISEGWLVGLKEVNVPVKIDTRKFRVKKTTEGNAFSVADQNEAYTPEVIQKLAHHYVQYASDRKGMIFVPSVEIARQMSAAIGALGLRSCFVSGECIDKNEKTDAFAADGPGSVLVNCTIYTFGIDFQDLTCVAPFGAMISKVKYIQSIYRGTRVLPGVLKEGMTQEERLTAIAASAKQYALVLSPFFISTRIDICEPFDLFSETHERSKKVTPPADFTKPGEIRDYIAALEKALNKHANKQPRTGDPVSWALAVGDEALAHYVPETAAEAKPASRGELDFIWEASKGALDTSAIKSSGEAQLTIQRLMERERLGLASVRHVQTLLRFGMNPDQVMTMKAGQAGAIIGRTTAKWDAARSS